MNKCSKCKASIADCDTYEYRGALSCEGCFDDVIAARDFERQEIIAEESAKTEIFRTLDIGDGPIGKANREILKGKIEAAGKESGRLKSYEGRAG